MSDDVAAPQGTDEERRQLKRAMPLPVTQNELGMFVRAGILLAIGVCCGSSTPQYAVGSTAWTRRIWGQSTTPPERPNRRHTTA